MSLGVAFSIDELIVNFEIFTRHRTTSLYLKVLPRYSLAIAQFADF